MIACVYRILRVATGAWRGASKCGGEIGVVTSPLGTGWCGMVTRGWSPRRSRTAACSVRRRPDLFAKFAPLTITDGLGLDTQTFMRTCRHISRLDRRTKRGAQGYGGRNEGECGVPSSGLHRTRAQTAAPSARGGRRSCAKQCSYVRGYPRVNVAVPTDLSVICHLLSISEVWEMAAHARWKPERRGRCGDRSHVPPLA